MFIEVMGITILFWQKLPSTAMMAEATLDSGGPRRTADRQLSQLFLPPETPKQAALRAQVAAIA
jgi:hypothetical protein